MSRVSENVFQEQRTVPLQDTAAARGSHLRETEVITLEWNAPASRIAVSKTDRSVRVWKVVAPSSDRPKVLPIVIESPHQRSVESLSWNPLVDNVLATVGNDRYVKTWNVSTGDLIKEIDSGEDRLLIVKYSPDGKYIVAISSSYTIIIIDPVASKIIHKLKLDVDIYSTVWNNGSDFLFVGLANGTIQVYRLRDNEINLVTSLKGHRSSIKSLAFDPKGRYLLAGSNEGVISIWSLADFSLLDIIAEVDESIHSIDCTSDGCFLAVTFEDRAPLRIYKIADRSLVFQLPKCVSGNQTFPTFRFSTIRLTYAFSNASGDLFFTMMPPPTASYRYD